MDLDDIIPRCQVLYDVAGSQVLSDAEWGQLINDSYRKLWRTVTRINKNFRISVDNFTLTAGTQQRLLQANYQETRFVLSDPGTEQEEILTRETERVAHSQWQRTYRLEGLNLVIEPLSRCAGNYAHKYIPRADTITDADAMDGELEQFVQYVIYDAVNVALKREESAPAYADDFAREEAAVISWASSQRSADPDKVEDVRRGNRWGAFAP